MNKWEKEVQQSLLDSEEAAIKELEKQYNQALKDINEKVKLFQADIDLLDQALSQDGLDDATKALLQSQKRSKVYQQQYQTALKGQVSGILDKMHSDNYTTIDKYLQDCYETGFIGTMYDITKQGIPIIAPIDQAAAVKAILTDSKVSNGLYNALGVNVGKLKKTITQEVSRGIASSLSYADIARNINNVSKTGLSNAERIARTEGHRIQQTSTRDAQQTAKANGADVVKQWDAALDGKTRDSHRRVDGEIRELDEKFSNGLMFPGDPAGGAEEVVNCRCACLTRARWALDEDELKTLQERAEYFGLDKTKNFDDFKSKYLSASKEIQTYEQKQEAVTVEDINKKGTDSLAETYERHRTKNGLSSVPYDELDDADGMIVGANYGKMSVESATAFNETLTKLSSEYDTPLQRVRTMTKNEFLGNSSSFAFVSHDYTVDSAELVINQAKCKDLEQLTGRIKELAEKGYCVKIPDELAERYVATHEFAHTLINLEQPLKNSTNWLGADYDKIKSARKEINSVYEKYMSEVEALTKAKKDAEFLALTEMTDESWKAATDAVSALNAVKLSNYSLQSADEFMAEAFANEKIGVSPNQYSKAVLEILDKYFKG